MDIGSKDLQFKRERNDGSVNTVVTSDDNSLFGIYILALSVRSSCISSNGRAGLTF